MGGSVTVTVKGGKLAFPCGMCDRGTSHLTVNQLLPVETHAKA
jgi:hypothetical protein